MYSSSARILVPTHKLICSGVQHMPILSASVSFSPSLYQIWVMNLILWTILIMNIHSSYLFGISLAYMLLITTNKCKNKPVSYCTWDDTEVPWTALEVTLVFVMLHWASLHCWSVSENPATKCSIYYPVQFNLVFVYYT